VTRTAERCATGNSKAAGSGEKEDKGCETGGGAIRGKRLDSCVELGASERCAALLLRRLGASCLLPVGCNLPDRHSAPLDGQADKPCSAEPHKHWCATVFLFSLYDLHSLVQPVDLL